MACASVRALAGVACAGLRRPCCALQCAIACDSLGVRCGRGRARWQRQKRELVCEAAGTRRYSRDTSVEGRTEVGDTCRWRLGDEQWIAHCHDRRWDRAGGLAWVRLTWLRCGLASGDSDEVHAARRFFRAIAGLRPLFWPAGEELV
eukprot:scaffold10067_cov67-Phaeocystis_antarctica.AAC.10